MDSIELKSSLSNLKNRLNEIREGIFDVSSKEQRLEQIEADLSKEEVWSDLELSQKGSGSTPHDHINNLDKELSLVNQKYSLVYYLSVGDQDCSEPGILRLYKPLKEIVPSDRCFIYCAAL